MNCYQPGRICVFPSPESESGALLARLEEGAIDADYEGVETTFADVVDANMVRREGREDDFDYEQLAARARQLPMREFTVVRVPEGREPEGARQFSRDSSVGFATPDYLLSAAGTRGDVLQDLELLLASIPSAPAPVCGQGVRVAVIDSGVDADILTKLRKRQGYLGESTGGVQASLDAFASPSSAARTGDDSGHGTAVAAIIKTVAPATTVVSIRVFSAGLGTLSSLVNGLLLLASFPDEIAIANLSLSGTPGNCGECGRTAKTGVELALATLLPATFRGNPPLILAAAGNRVGPRPLAFPANCPGVVAVGSYQAATNGTTYTAIDPNSFYLADDFSTSGQARFRGTSFGCALTTGITARYACSLHPAAPCAQGPRPALRGSIRDYLETRLAATADRAYSGYDRDSHGQGRATLDS